MRGMISVLILTAAILTACTNSSVPSRAESIPQSASLSEPTVSSSFVSSSPATALVTEGTETYRGFVLDNVLHSETEGDIHYNVYIPDSYDGSTPYALFFTLPG